MRRSATRATISPSVVCEGYWRRKSPLTCSDVTPYYQLKHRDWYGVPRHKTMLLLEDGSTKTYEGTFRSSRCLKLAVNVDNSPTGTMTCNQCPRVSTFQSFVSMALHNGMSKEFNLELTCLFCHWFANSQVLIHFV